MRESERERKREIERERERERERVCERDSEREWYSSIRFIYHMTSNVLILITKHVKCSRKS